MHSKNWFSFARTEHVQIDFYGYWHFSVYYKAFGVLLLAHLVGSAACALQMHVSIWFHKAKTTTGLVQFLWPVFFSYERLTHAQLHTKNSFAQRHSLHSASFSCRSRQQPRSKQVVIMSMMVNDYYDHWSWLRLAKHKHSL